MAALFVEDIVFDEGDGIISIIVRLTEPATQAVTVNYATANGTALGNSDLTGVSGMLLTFLVGQTARWCQ